MFDFSARLTEERNRLGLSQEAFGAIAGVSKMSQLNYEKGVRKPDAGYLMAVAEQGVDVAYLLTGQRLFDPNAIQHERPEPTLAARLQQERQRLNLSEAELARKAGQAKQVLQQFESGALVPDATALQQLHLAGVDIGYVLLSLRSHAPDADVQALLAHYGKATDAGRALLRGVAELAGRG